MKKYDCAFLKKTSIPGSYAMCWMEWGTGIKASDKG